MRSLPVALLLVAGCAKPYLGARPDRPPPPPVPAGVAYASETFAARDGTILYARSWRPAGEPRAVVVIMHGLRDHGDRYAAFATRLVARGYAVHAFDLRGHGRSAGRRVTVGAFDDYVADLDTFVTRVRDPARPLFVFGHSMGGAIVALWAERQPAVAGVILSAPAIRIDTLPLVAAATMLAGTLTPNAGGLAPSNANFSTDPAVEADMGRDPLIYQPPGPTGTAAELVRGIERVWAGAGRLTAPLLCLHGTGDKLTAPAGSRELVARAGGSDKTLRLYDGAAHDLVHEPRRDEVAADVLAWLDAHTGGAPAGFAPPAPGPLRGDGHKPSAAVSLEAAYRRGDEESGQWGGAGLRARFLLGTRLAWPLALDAEALGGDSFLFRLAAYPAGVAFVAPGGSTVSLAAGAGLSGIGDGADVELPIALDAEAQLGPVRLLVWGRVAWVLDDARDGGTDLPFGDELHAGVALRLGRDHRFWSTVNAGAGPYLGVTLDQQVGVTILGVALGLHLWGGS